MFSGHVPAQPGFREDKNPRIGPEGRVRRQISDKARGPCVSTFRKAGFHGRWRSFRVEPVMQEEPAEADGREVERSELLKGSSKRSY